MQGVAATINGVSAQIFIVSPGQLTIQVPYEVECAFAFGGYAASGGDGRRGVECAGEFECDATVGGFAGR